MSITSPGATVTASNGYTFYKFTSGTGTITFPSNTTAQVLIVGGGGGGGGTASNNEGGGGGGAGGVGVGSLTFTSNITYSISIGNGGVGGIANGSTSFSTSGGNTTITGGTISETANGGGYGGHAWTYQTGGNGGSGGGGNGSGNNYPGGTSTRGSGSLTYYGNAGGSGPHFQSGGGGGGATSIGTAGADNSGGNGGSGYTWTINGGVYGGGGGGGLEGTSYATLGTGTAGSSSGGGGNGGSSSVSAVAGTANTGGGGGGAYGGSGGSGGTGGAGGSGVVIIAIRIPTVTKTFDYTLYTFTDTNTSYLLNFTSDTTAQVLIVGGGGGGGNGSPTNYEGGGGGGGGGVGVGSLTFTAGASYTITVGAGGRGGNSTAGASNRSLSGTNTSISGTGISETAYGGGMGADNGYLNTGSSGGSGGGGTGYGGTNAGGSSTDGAGSLTYYGSSGGTAVGGSSGGGGGALNDGISSTSGSGGVGGDGYHWNVNEGVYGSGGGGGMAGSNQTTISTIAGSGSGGGGYGGGAFTGGASSTAATAGTANTGGGGGGGWGGAGTGGAGGSGIVVVAVPTRPWGAYISGYGLNTTTSLYDITGNGRHAIIGGSGLTTTSGSGNGASASIPYITGTTATNITWPAGSIPSQFTLCSITRYNGSNKQRILEATNINFAHGHFGNSAGFAYYQGWVTGTSNSNSNNNSTNWVVMCGTNGTDATTNAKPNNILVNGVGFGDYSGGNGNGQLSINNDTTNSSGGSGQYSEFAFNMVLIFNYALTNDELLSISNSMTSYLTTGNNAYFIQSTILPIPKPWGAYIASNSTSSGLVDYTGQSRDATFGGTLTYNAASYLTAKQTIPVIYGSDTVLGSITWPTGSIPSTFTICSITRYNLTGRRGRIFDAAVSGANWLHGHWSGNIGVAHYNSWKTNYVSPNGRLSSGVDATEWVVMCSTNGTNNQTPYNILANGIGVGTVNGGAANWQLTINAGTNSGEWSGFAFNQVIIWDVALTNTQLKYMSDILQNYLLSGIMTYPWLATPSYTFNSSIGLDTNSLIMYYPFDIDAKNYATGTGVTSGTSTGSPTFPTTYTKLTTGSLYLNGSTQYFEPTTSYTLTASGFTAGVWFKLSSYSPSSGGGTIRLFDFGNTPNTGSSSVAGSNHISLNFVYSTATSMTLNFTTVSSAVSLNYVANFILLDFKWHHYCVTISKTFYLSFYVDGLYSGGSQLRRIDLPIDVALTNKCYIGRSNFYGAQTNLTNGYFNSFIIYNRCLEPSELTPLLLIKNATLNGYFNSFRTPGDVTGITGNVPSITNNSYLSNPSIMRVIPGWSFTGGCTDFIIQSGNNNFLLTTLKLTSAQHYFIMVQFWKRTNTQTMQQVIRFTPGTYTLYYTVAGRPGNYNSTNTITSSITNLLSDYTPTLSSTSWTTVDQRFTVTTEQLQALTFVFKAPIYMANVTGIILRSVYIVKNTNYLANETDITLYGTVPVIQSSMTGLTTTITNSLVSNTYIQEGRQELFTNSAYYMHGKRNPTGFKVNDIDIGQYFQQTLPFDGSYGHCFEIEYNAFGTVANISDTDARVIWPENIVASQTSFTNSVYYWLYYTFYYGGSANTGNMYWRCDNYAYIYFNNTGIGNSSNSLSISILNGLNYIRVAAYNAGAVGTGNPGGFYAALKNSGGSVVAVTNTNWTWSLTPSTYSTDASYSDITGALTYNYPPLDPPIVSGLTYNTGSGSQFPTLTFFRVLYITSGSGTVTMPIGANIVNIFVVGGGAGGSSGGSCYPGLGGGVSNNAVNFSGNNTFTISVGNGGSGGANGGGNAGSTGTQSTCVCAALSVNYVGSGGTVATSNTGSVTGTQYSYNSLYYGGSGGNGSYPGVGNTQGAPLGGGGGGGGVGYYAAQGGLGSAGGTGGGISASLTGGAFGAASVSTSVDASPGTSSPYGGGGGGGGGYSSSTGKNGGAGGAGSGTATGGGGSAGIGGASIKGGGGGGGNGGVNTGGGGGGGGGTNTVSALGGGGAGGSGIVIIVYF